MNLDRMTQKAQEALSAAQVCATRHGRRTTIRLLDRWRSLDLLAENLLADPQARRAARNNRSNGRPRSPSRQVPRPFLSKYSFRDPLQMQQPFLTTRIVYTTGKFLRRLAPRALWEA